MARPTKQESLAILDRRQRVANAYLQGRTQHEIARREGVSRSTVRDDLDAVRKDWLASSLQDFDARRAQELAKTDRLEAVAWEGWERSCENAEGFSSQTVKGRTGKDGKALPALTKRAEWSKGQGGDPRFLEQVTKCIERRCKLLGLDEPEKYEHTVSVEERRTRLTGILAALRERAGAG